MQKVCGVRNEIDNNLIKFYNRIQGEAPAETRDPENVKDLTVNWPARGSIEFKNYFVKYRPNLPHVIDNLSVSINSAEKVFFNGNLNLKSLIRLVLLEEQAQENQLSSCLY